MVTAQEEVPDSAQMGPKPQSKGDWEIWEEEMCSLMMVMLAKDHFPACSDLGIIMHLQGKIQKGN